jgi:hypothetical protein
MPKSRKKKAKPYPSRASVVYVGVPRVYGALLDSMTEDGGKYEGRSRAFLAKLALRRFLQAEGLLDDKGKPIKPGEAKG